MPKQIVQAHPINGPIPNRPTAFGIPIDGQLSPQQGIGHYSEKELNLLVKKGFSPRNPADIEALEKNGVCFISDQEQKEPAIGLFLIQFPDEQQQFSKKSSK